MFFGERSEETLGQERNSIEFVATGGERQDGDVDGAGSQTVEKDGRNLLDDGEPNLGKFG